MGIGADAAGEHVREVNNPVGPVGGLKDGSLVAHDRAPLRDASAYHSLSTWPMRRLSGSTIAMVPPATT